MPRDGQVSYVGLLKIFIILLVNHWIISLFDSEVVLIVKCLLCWMLPSVKEIFLYLLLAFDCMGIYLKGIISIVSNIAIF
jgi:hypothetical protein